jgi:hypothetical protein
LAACITAAGIRTDALLPHFFTNTCICHLNIDNVDTAISRVMCQQCRDIFVPQAGCAFGVSRDTLHP